MRAPPLVSVVIPTRDRWELLSRHALPSALAQRGVDLEVVVVDDGSSDGTADRIRELGDERVTVIRHATPRGVSEARNTGLRAARGRWLALLDDDDLWAPTKLAAQLAAVGGCGWCFCDGVIVDRHLRVIGVLTAPSPDGLAHALRRGNVVVGGSSCVFALTALIRDVGAWDARLRSAEDWDLWLRLAEAAPAAAVRQPLVATLDHAGRSFARHPGEARVGIERFLDRIGAERAVRQGALEWLAAEHYRVGRRLTAARTYAHAALTFRSPGNAVAAVAAIAGDRGIRLSDRLLGAGRSHLAQERHAPTVEPTWLAELREAR
jgi:glycosyltransferase involved in cell wall biosynthesis